MIKKVNIYPQKPIFGLRMPINGVVMGAEMLIGDIKHCICNNAHVDEILKDGKTLVRLSLANFDKDNEPIVEKKVEEKKTEENPPVNSTPPKQPEQKPAEVVTPPVDKTEEIPLVDKTTEKVDQNTNKNKK